MTSDRWKERLSGALDTGDGLAAGRVVGSVTADPESRDELLALLARRAASGSEPAAELLTETVDALGLARAGVRRVLVDEAAIDDVTQDTLVSMVTSVRSFRGESRFTTWLHRIARNRAVDHLRRQRATEPLGDDVGEARRISSIVATRHTVRELVDRLPERYRDAVVLRDVDRLAYTEVAHRLGLNLNTAKSHVARGRALLARMLESEGVG